MAYSCPNCRRTVEAEDTLCLDCGADIMKVAQSQSRLTDEKKQFKNRMLDEFQAAMLQVVDAEFYIGMDEDQKKDFLQGAYKLYRIGVIDGIKQLGESLGADMPEIMEKVNNG